MINPFNKPKNSLTNFGSSSEDISKDLADISSQLESLGARWIIHTDVATDGAMQGPNLEAQQKMAQSVPNCQVIASGGVTRESDIDNLEKLAVQFPNIEGVIVGKALYEGTVLLKNLFA